MKNLSYVNLYGEIVALDELDAESAALVNRLRRRARAQPDWCEFSTFATQAIAELYDKRGISRAHARPSPVLQLAHDLSNRLGIAQGHVAPPTFDYREQLERLVLQFPTRRAFCEAAGMSRTMLSHVLAGRKDLSVASLLKVLDRLGYRLQFTPAAKAKRTG